MGVARVLWNDEQLHYGSGSKLQTMSVVAGEVSWD
jgi:hypothetical protein